MRRTSLFTASTSHGASATKSVATAAEAFALGDEPFSWVLKGGRHRNVSVLRHLPRRAALEGALAAGGGTRVATVVRRGTRVGLADGAALFG